MPCDLFISYSRRDNERGQVAGLKAQIESSFRAFAGRDLRVFFDTHEIAGMDDWRQKIQRSLRDSQVFLAVLSPNYLASAYCRWEWEDYVRYEAMRQCLGEGVAPVFFVTLPDAADPKTDQAVARWIDEIQRRQTFDLRPWHDAGEQALQQAHVRQTLEQLHASVRERLDRAERSRSSPNNLIKHNPAFVGRVRELTELRHALTKNKLGVVGAREGQTPSQPSTINSQPPAVVQGLGGMGKTELALAYAHAFAWDYPGGRWQSPCEHFSDLRVALLHLANANALNFEFTEDEKKNIALAFERVLRELNRRERCLLILDNVSDPNLLQPEHLDRLPRDGRVDLIATTRLAPRAIPGSANEQSFIAVDELPEEDALALMRSHQPEGRFASQQEDDEARAIVRLLRGFTLAVETAAIYLGRDTAPDTCRRFRERLSPDLLRESETAATDPAVAVRHRVRSLKETLAFTLQTLTPEARHLLDYGSLLHADQVAVPWLKTLGAAKFSAFSVEAEPASNSFRQALELLLGLRLFQTTEVVNADGQPLVVRMHRLVQDLLRGQQSADNANAQQNAVNELMTARATALNETTKWQEARWEVGPFGALAQVWADTKHPRAAWLLSQAGGRWHHLAEWARAEPLLRRALAIDEHSLGSDHPNVATDLNNLAEVLYATNRIADAELLYRRALRILERSVGENHPTSGVCVNNLAGLLRATNRLEEAEEMYRRALAIAEASYGPNHATVALALNNLAGLLEQANRLADAELMYRTALAVDEHNYGSEHPTVATRLSNLTGLLYATNRLAEAEPLIRRALAIDEQAYGPNHPSVARDLGNLTALLQATTRLAESEPLIRRALAIDEQTFGPNHPIVATHLGNLAGLLKATNRLAEAEQLFRRALTIYEQTFGSSHPDVGRNLSNLGELLLCTNRLAEAEPLLRDALSIAEQSLAPDHPTIALRLNNLAGLLLTTNRSAEAEPLLGRALTISERSMGADHPNVATILNSIAYLLRATNRQAESEPLLRRVVEIFLKFTKTTGHEHPHLRNSVDNYGAVLRQMGYRQDEVLARLNAVVRPFGFGFGESHNE